MAKLCLKIILEDLNPLPPLKIIKFSYLFRILNLRAKIRFAQIQWLGIPRLPLFNPLHRL